MKKLKYLFAIVLLCWPAWALAQETALGVSSLSNRNQAISQATANANAQILVQKIVNSGGAEALRTAWERLSQEVFSNPAPYIASFKTLAVGQTAEQTWVLVEAQINESAFEPVLASVRAHTTAVVAPKVQPILCLVCEDVAPGRPALYWWSGQAGLAVCPARIDRGLKQIGYGPLNPSNLQISPDISSNVVLSEAQSLSLGAQAGSKLVLWGRIRAYPILSPNASESTPLVQLALLDSEQKRMLGQVEVAGAVFRDNLPAGFEDSMDKEVAEALAKLFELAKVPVSAPPTYTVVVEMAGIKNTAQLARLERALLRLPTVTQVQRESISSGKATLLLTAAQDGLQLAEALSRLEGSEWLRLDERGAALLRLTPVGD